MAALLYYQTQSFCIWKTEIHRETSEKGIAEPDTIYPMDLVKQLIDQRQSPDAGVILEIRNIAEDKADSEKALFCGGLKDDLTNIK